MCLLIKGNILSSAIGSAKEGGWMGTNAHTLKARSNLTAAHRALGNIVLYLQPIHCSGAYYFVRDPRHRNEVAAGLGRI